MGQPGNAERFRTFAESWEMDRIDPPLVDAVEAVRKPERPELGQQEADLVLNPVFEVLNKKASVGFLASWILSELPAAAEMNFDA
jgi:hypothetical protein